MSVNAFEEFANAMASGGREARQGAVAPKRFGSVAVLGGGADARMIAALCLSQNVRVSLFSAYGSELELLRSRGGVTIRGDGPVGTYQVDREGIPSIQTTGQLDRAISGAEAVFLTGPVHKQRTYAMVLADHMADGQVLVLAPGRSLGAAEAAWLLRVGGCTADYTIVEVQNLPFWIEESGSSLNLSSCLPAAAATLPAGRIDALEAVNALMGNLKSVSSTVHSGFADGSALVEVPALLLGGPAIPDGLPEIPAGASQLEANRTFRSLVGERHMKVIARLAEERRAVAARFGVRGLPSTDEWLDIHAGSARNAGSRRIPAAAEAIRLVRCGTIGSLVPLQSAAEVSGMEVPVTEAMIALVSTVLDADIQSAGRRLSNIGIMPSQVDEARRVLDEVAGVER